MNIKVLNNIKHIQKLKNLNVKAEKCINRKEAKKILIKANKAQKKINF